MDIVVAQREDILGWLALAAEVEPLFGPLVDDPGFQQALARCIARGTAFCVREGDGPPGAPLLGGLLFSAGPPVYTIGWLAVAEDARRRGVGRALVAHVTGLVQAPAELVVTTFAPGSEGGEAARQLYAEMGFHPAETTAGPRGERRQVYRRPFPVQSAGGC